MRRQHRQSKRNVDVIDREGTESIFLLQLHQVWLTWLPIYEDTEETPHVYGYLCDLIES